MEISYTIHYSARRSISIQISGESLIVRAPFGMSDKKIQDFINSKKNWILNHLQREKDVSKKAGDLGFFSEKEIMEIKKKAKNTIPQRVEYFAKLWGFSYNKIFIRLQKSRWGSCSSNRNLNFNCILVLMPTEVLDAVVVHELCHLKYMNHSRNFYKEVLKIMPDYKKWDKWLKENGAIYLKRVSKVL